MSLKFSNAFVSLLQVSVECRPCLGLGKARLNFSQSFCCLLPRDQHTHIGISTTRLACRFNGPLDLVLDIVTRLGTPNLQIASFIFQSFSLSIKFLAQGVDV